MATSNCGLDFLARALTSGRIATVMIFVASSALPESGYARCAINDYVYQDQDGNEALVKDIRECFSIFDHDASRILGNAKKCLTEQDLNPFIKAHKNRDLRLVGTRVYEIFYKDQPMEIAEFAVSGAPSLSYEVDSKDVKNTSNFKTADIYGKLDGETNFDFSDDAPEGFDTPKKLYKDLYGRRFTFKKCQPNYAADAAAGSAKLVVIDLARRLVAAGNGEKLESNFYSTNFKRFNAHIDQKHWREFDSDPLTGVQDFGGYHIDTIKEDDISRLSHTVTVTYVSSGNKNVIRYVMIRQDNTWKINDIIYVNQSRSSSFRNIMTAPVPQ